MSEVFEAFVYIWYDSKNRMYYIGKHKGTPDDGYTHSSTIMESFKSNEVPPYMKRKILAFGTHEEMLELENKLLKNRKAKCWDRYYNRGLGDPRVVDQWGENNPYYKHGLTGTPEYERERHRIERAENPEKFRERDRKYYAEKREEIKERRRKKRVENPEKFRERDRKYYEENREKRRKYYEENREEINERRCKQLKTLRLENPEKFRERERKYYEENREKILEKRRKAYEKKKLEKERANSTSLDVFMS